MTDFEEIASLEARAKQALERVDVLRDELDAALTRIAHLEKRHIATRLYGFNVPDRVSKLEQRLTRPHDFDEPGEPFEEWTERQLDKLAAGLREETEIRRRIDDHHAEHIGRLQLSEKQTDDALTGLNERFSQQERKRRTLVESQNDWTTQFGERLVQMEQALRDYGIPTPVVAQNTEWSGPPRASVASFGMMVVPEGDPGPILEEAVKRVEGYMRGSFSEGTIGGVVHAIRGTEDHVTDHSFRWAAGDRRHCSYVYNREENPCGKTRAEHAMKGGELPVRPKPIKDRPQG